MHALPIKPQGGLKKCVNAKGILPGFLNQDNHFAFFFFLQ